MWQGKRKAITFSFDDGVVQDVKTIDILDKYGLKATFNLNSALLGRKETIVACNHRVKFNKNLAKDVEKIYRNHEIAVHTLSHANLTKLEESTIIRQIEEDRKTLSGFCGYKIIGMAYPYGVTDERVRKVINDNTPLKYARTGVSSYSFDLQEDLLNFNPTIHVIEENLFEVVNSFLNTDTDKPQLLYIWGNSYEMDAKEITWEKFEELCKLVSNREDIYYGTNREVLISN